ncbi:MAG: cobalamin B12-binding domain-containing protein [Roseovarius sp.]|nr:cobalamin B12-binding domain-containing protein [Roseovarius sp.]
MSAIPGMACRRSPEPHPRDVTVIFASVPGEQHTLGIRMAADLFRGDGWEIALRVGLSEDELIAGISRQPRCIVGLSVGGRHSLDGLTALVKALHRHCPHVAIVVLRLDRMIVRRWQQDTAATGASNLRITLSALLKAAPRPLT